MQRHPFVNSGTTQEDRLPNALRPDSFKLAGQTTDEMISFAYQLGKCINFYNDKDEVEGTWQCFFDSEPSTLLAQICMIDTETIALKYENLEASFIQDHEDYMNENKPECCLLYTSPSPRDATLSRMPSSA